MVEKPHGSRVLAGIGLTYRHMNGIKRILRQTGYKDWDS
jgi:hypothetical protein